MGFTRSREQGCYGILYFLCLRLCRCLFQCLIYISGFAARCEAGLSPAVTTPTNVGLCPRFGLGPSTFQAKGRTGGPAPKSFFQKLDGRA